MQKIVLHVSDIYCKYVIARRGLLQKGQIIKVKTCKFSFTYSLVIHVSVYFRLVLFMCRLLISKQHRKSLLSCYSM